MSRSLPASPIWPVSARRWMLLAVMSTIEAAATGMSFSL